MEDVIRKIQKAIALSGNNPNAQEAQSAMLMAQRLMAKHNLTMGDVSTQKTEKKTDKGFIRLGRVEWWQRRLAYIISSNFRCHSYFVSGSHMGFIGLEEDVKIAVELFEYGCQAIRHLSSQYLISRQSQDGRRTRRYAVAIKNDYINGFLSGLDEKFKEQVASESLALVLVRDEIVDKAYEEMNVKEAKAATRSTASDTDATQQGYIDGKNFEKPRAALEAMDKIVISRDRDQHYGFRVVTKKGGKLVGFYDPITHTFTGALEFEGKKFVGTSRTDTRKYINDMYIQHQAKAN